jgi:hypothetical protein
MASILSHQYAEMMRLLLRFCSLHSAIVALISATHPASILALALISATHPASLFVLALISAYPPICCPLFVQRILARQYVERMSLHGRM